MGIVKLELDEALVRIIQVAGAHDLAILADFIKNLKLLKGHDAVAFTWRKKVVGLGLRDNWCVAESVLVQKLFSSDYEILRYGEVAAAFPKLSQRQCQIVAGIVGGKQSKEIAAELGLASTTAKLYVRETLRALGLSNRTQIAVLAIRKCNIKPQTVAAETLFKLSQKERQVVVEVVRGGRDAEIANALSLSVPTVKTRLRAISLKLGGLSNRTQLAVLAVLSGDPRYNVIRP